MNPTPPEVARALDTLRAAGWTLSPPAPSPRRLFSLAEAAEQLGVHARTVRRYVALGWMHAVSLPGNDLRIEAEELRLFVVNRPKVVPQEAAAA